MEQQNYCMFRIGTQDGAVDALWVFELLFSVCASAAGAGARHSSRSILLMFALWPAR